MKTEHKFDTKPLMGLAFMAALAAGLYPLIYLYTSNHTLLLSWGQFGFLLLLFVALPILMFLCFALLTKKIAFFKDYYNRILAVLNVSVFLSLLVYGVYGFKKKILVLVAILAVVLGILLYKHLKKIIKFQFLLAGIGLLFLVPTVVSYFNYSNDWQKQPDHIESVIFKNTPNIYVIQPDGYIGLSEIGQGNYNKDNSDFNTFLLDNDFKLYPNFRSNYYSTLSSNSSMFSMKHHYYNRNLNVGSELLFARDIIVSENPVLSILKNNGYRTSLILENSYLLANRPKMGYDFSTIDYSDLSVVSSGFDFKRDVLKDLKSQIKTNLSGKHFYFIERISPGHITTYQSASEGAALERQKYLDRLADANSWLKNTLALINSNDANALIIIVADHGGFVGYDYSAQSHIKPKNRADTFSMFSSLLAIKWPDNNAMYNADIQTSVNLFRTVFSALSEDTSLLKNIESDASFLSVNEGAPLGIYKVIDKNNKAIFKAFITD
ncbi:sulfatase-like hydrolase/transferase [Winogradskyella sp.]|nr:sulfatase-like hydrolase/transferase [Winogradskyella sp.]